MYLSNGSEFERPVRQRRRFRRYEVQCRARIRIGTRQYAGYIHNISASGAKLRTIGPIRKLGIVILRLPDLPPLRCRLCWTDGYNAGVSFEMRLSQKEFRRWARSRLRFDDPYSLAASEFAELVEPTS